MNPTQKSIFFETLQVLSNEDVLPHLILIGSWVEYVYQKVGYYKGFKSNFKTIDVDFLIPNIRKPNKEISLCKIMENQGFIVRQDPLNNLLKFSQGEGPIEVEFIARQLGAGQVEPYIKNLGIKVEGLRNLDILVDNATQLFLNKYIVRVPLPQAYVLHKLIINKQRGIKQNKDLESVENLLPFIKKNSSELKILVQIYDKLTKKQKSLINKVCNETIINLFD